MIFIMAAAILAAIPWREILPENIRGRMVGFSVTGAGILTKRVLLIILLLVSLMFVVNSTYNPFIYFRF